MGAKAHSSLFSVGGSFTDIKNKKIIEYNGDDYHGNPNKYNFDDYPNPFRKDLTAKDIWNKDKQKKRVSRKKWF